MTSRTSPFDLPTSKRLATSSSAPVSAPPPPSSFFSREMTLLLRSWVRQQTPNGQRLDDHLAYKILAMNTPSAPSLDGKKPLKRATTICCLQNKRLFLYDEMFHNMKLDCGHQGAICIACPLQSFFNPCGFCRK